MERASHEIEPSALQAAHRTSEFWDDTHRWIWLWGALGVAASVGRDSHVWPAIVWIASFAALIAIAGSSGSRKTAWRVLVCVMWIDMLVSLAERMPEGQSSIPLRYMAALLGVGISLGFALLLAKEADDRGARDAAKRWRLAAAAVAMLGALGLARMPWGSMPVGASQTVSSNLLGILALLLLATLWVCFIRAASATTSLATAARGVCARCGFDLHGISGPLCPECGEPFEGEFPAHRAGTSERRQRPRLRPWLLAGALAIPPAFAAYALSPDNRHEAYKPLWLLIRDAKLLAPARESGIGAQFAANGSGALAEHPGAVRAQDELLARIKAGRMTAEDCAGLVSHALEIQSDSERPLGKWLEIFEAAYLLGGVPRSELERAFLGCAQWRLVTRKRIAVGDPFPMRLQLLWRGPDRATRLLPGANEFGYGVDLVLTDLRLGDQPMRDIPFRFSQGGSFGSWFDPGSFRRESMPPVPTPAATGNLSLTGRLQARWDRDLRIGFGPQQLVALGLPTKWAVPLNAQCEVLPAGTPTVRAREHPDLASEFLEHVQLSMNLEHRFLRVGQFPGTTVREWPADIAIDVLADVEGRWVHLGAVVWPKEGWARGINHLTIDKQIANQLDATNTDTITLRLRPSVDAAKLAVDVDEVLVGPEFDVEVPKR